MASLSKRFAVLAALTALSLLAAPLVHPTCSCAEPIGALTLPDSVPDVRPDSPLKLEDPPPASDAWAAPGNRPLGITLSNYDLTVEQVKAASATGCGLARLTIPMEGFLDGNDADWATLDQVVSRLNRGGFEILAVLDALVPQREFYRDFCRRVASRYGASIRYYQLLDNINYKIGLSTRDYAALLSVCEPTIRAGAKDAVIVSGGIRGCDMTYLGMLESQHALSHLDVLAFTLFPPADGIEQVSQSARPEHCLPYMEQAVVWAKARGKRVWVTSLGCSTDSTWVGMDEVQQASAYSRGALILGWLGVERVVFAAIQDNDPSYSIPAKCCGLLRVDGKPKASYFVLQALNRVVDGAYHVRVPFTCAAQTFTQPGEADIHGLHDEAEASSRAAFAGKLSAMDVAINSGNRPGIFQTHGVQVFSYWFYAPASREYRLVYWLADDQPYPCLLTLQCATAGRRTGGALVDHLTPDSAYQMLDYHPYTPEHMSAQNMLVVEYQPLEAVPSVISFTASDSGVPQTGQPTQPTLPAPAVPGLSFRR